MLFSGYTPTLAGGAATLLMLVLAVLCRVASCVRERRPRDIGKECARLGAKIWDGLIDGGKGVIVIAVLLASASLLVTVLSATGLGVKFSQLLLGFGGDYLVGVLLISALLCIMLGMDVPTTASYLLTASVAAPALTKLGLQPLTAHLFIFYFAILSAITPPVCASVYAAATIIGENFWRVAGQALRIAGAVFFIPFMMVYRPEIMLQGPALTVAYHVAISWAAIVAISGGSIGYLLGPLGWGGRIYLYVAAATLFYPSTYSDFAGVALVLAYLGWRWKFGSSRTT
jgi:TRAP-type uncharacterized transport system fused permease subunit